MEKEQKNDSFSVKKKNIYEKLNDILTIICIVLAVILCIVFIVLKNWGWLCGSIISLFVFYFIMSLFIDHCSSLFEIAKTLKEMNERDKERNTK